MKIKVNIKRYLSTEQIDGFTRLGLAEELEKEVEVEVEKFIEDVVAAEVAKATAEIEARLIEKFAAADTSGADQSDDSTPDSTDDDTTPDSADDDDTKNADALTDNEAQIVSCLLTQLNDIKKALETE